MILIDTNLIIRFITKDPAEHYEKSKSFFEKIAKREIKAVITESVLMECYFVLHKLYKIDKQIVIKKLKTLLEFQNIVNDDKYILIEALNILNDTNIDFVDCLLCAKSRLLDYDIVSFDKDIKKCSKKIIKL